MSESHVDHGPVVAACDGAVDAMPHPAVASWAHGLKRRFGRGGRARRSQPREGDGFRGGAELNACDSGLGGAQAQAAGLGHAGRTLGTRVADKLSRHCANDAVAITGDGKVASRVSTVSLVFQIIGGVLAEGRVGNTGERSKKSSSSPAATGQLTAVGANSTQVRLDDNADVLSASRQHGNRTQTKQQDQRTHSNVCHGAYVLVRFLT